MADKPNNTEKHEAASTGALLKDRELFASLEDVRFDATAAAKLAVQTDSLTLDAYGRIQFAYDYFRDALFGGDLGPCILTFNRKTGSVGYFGPGFYASTEGNVAHEISLHTGHFESRGDRVTLSTLVHEQCHLKRHESGVPNRRGGKGARGYHDKPWAIEMLRVGLRPTDDGTWSGKMTGYRMTHLIIENGPFDLACRALLETGFEIRWRDRRPTVRISEMPDEPEETTPPKGTRSKFTCPSCGQNAWAKPASRLDCGKCSRPLIREA